MISIIINVFVTTTILYTLILTNRTAEKINSNILLGVSLPPSALEDNETTTIVQRFHKACNLEILFFFLLILPLLFISSYISISILYILIWCLLLFFTQRTIQKRYFNQLYSLKLNKDWFVGENQITNQYMDDDYFWKSGSYNNPNDKRIWVDKRIGIGRTINMGSWFGTFTYVFLAATIVGTILLSLYLMPLDFGTVGLEVKDNNVLIEAPMYTDSFSFNDIQVITLMDHLPRMSKQRGGDSDHFYVGRFQVNGYGNCSVYVHRNKPPYILVTLTDRIIILNGDTPEKTEDFYRILKSYRIND